MEKLRVILFIVSFFMLIIIYAITPYVIIKHIIKKRLLRQKRTIQTLIAKRLLAAEHIFKIEWTYLIGILIASVPFIIGTLLNISEASVKEIIRQMPFHIKEDFVNWPAVPLAYYKLHWYFSYCSI